MTVLSSRLLKASSRVALIAAVSVLPPLAVAQAATSATDHGRRAIDRVPSIRRSSVTADRSAAGRSVLR